ncbi:MAG TPA: ABC transporter substrate-binding protein [Pseudonocardiaceae bacterium]|jgi:NitT/TauT family transport system substrate-binding protein|nr:ABC transporter substrate-binding protein [Pseudonocardiaceae bacterium]
MNELSRARPGTTRRRRLGATAVAAVAMMLLTGCSLLNGSNSTSTPSAGNSKVEKPTVTIGILTSPDVAPLKLAQLEGLFKAQGLNPVVKVFASGPAMYPDLVNGSLDIAQGNYVNYFQAVAAGTLDAKVIADAYSGTPTSFVLLTPPNSPIKTPADLAGKTIATQAPGNIVELLLRSLLASNNVDPNSPHYVPIHFPDMPNALKTGTVDAAVDFEPFITEAERDFGAKEPFPLITNATNGMPLSGYFATSKFINANPKTIAAFQRAMVQASAKAASRSELGKVLPALTGVSPSLVPMLNIGAYPTSLDPTRLQRVITLMKTYGGLTTNLDAKTLIVPLPPNS